MCETSILDELTLENTEEMYGNCRRRRNRKHNRKASHSSQKAFSSYLSEDRFRKVPQRSRQPQCYFKRGDHSKIDIMGQVKKETQTDSQLGTTTQVSFENRVLELLSKCREFWPKIYKKLEKLASTKKVSYDCSRTNSEIVAQLSGQGKIFISLLYKIL